MPTVEPSMEFSANFPAPEASGGAIPSSHFTQLMVSVGARPLKSTVLVVSSAVVATRSLFAFFFPCFQAKELG